MQTSTQSAVIVVLFSFMCLVGSPSASAQENLGLVSIKSAWGAYLQAHTNGELHASNNKRNEEETWFLIRVDNSKRIYAIYNWKNGRFMSKRGNCAPAVSTVLGPAEQWRLESGKPYGAVNAVIFRSVADNTILGTNNPGKDSECGGEVTSKDIWGPGGIPIPVNNSGWGGWWVISPATPPTQGRDFWNTVGGALADIANKITPDDAAELAALLF